MIFHICFASLAVFVAAVGPVDQSAGEPPASPHSESSGKPMSPERLPLPSGTIIFVGDSVQVPAKDYQRLLEELARLKKSPSPSKNEALISVLGVNGQVAQDGAGRETAALQMKLEFRTDAEDALVPIGLKGVKLTGATLDGETPVWGPDPNALAVQVKAAKAYQLLLEMQVPVTRAGAERRIVIERVPRAAITTLNVRVPGAIQRAAVNGARVKTEVDSERQQTRLFSEGLGSLDQFELVWTAGAGGIKPSGPPVASIGDLQVVIGETVVDTEARLRIEPRHGGIPRLRFRVGGDTVVFQVDRVEGEGRLVPMESWTFSKETRILMIDLASKPPAAATDSVLELRLQLQQNHSGKSGTTVALGQLDLIEPKGALQTGKITVATDLRVTFQRQELKPTRATGPETRAFTYAFVYGQQPVDLKAQLEPVPAVQPIIEVKTLHTVRVTGASILLTSEFDLTRITRTTIQELEVAWPEAFTLDPRIPPANLTIDDPRDGVVRVQLSPAQQAPLKFKLEGRLPIPDQGKVNLALPALVQARGKRDKAQIVLLPAELRIVPENLEVWALTGSSALLNPTGRLVEPEARLQGPSTFTLEPPTPQTPWRLALAWQSRRHDVTSAAEVFLTQRELVVRQTLQYRFAGTPSQLLLRVPPEIENLLEARLAYWNKDRRRVEGAVGLMERPAGADSELLERAVLLPPRDLPESCEIILTYRKPLSQAPDKTSLVIPLVRPHPSQVVLLPSEVRIWASGDLKPGLAKGQTSWQLASPSQISGAEVVPALDLRAASPDESLTIVRTRQAEKALVAIVAQRALIEVSSLATGSWDYRARFRFSRVGSDQITVLLPSSARVEKLSLNQEEIALKRLEVTEAGDNQTQLRVPLDPWHLGSPVLLDLHFRVPAPARWWSGYWNSLPAPRLAGPALVESTRWRVELPAGRLPLYHSSAHAAEQPWQSVIWLRAPQPTASAEDLERWLLGTDAEVLAAEARWSYRFVQYGDLTPLSLVSLPQQVWVLICSLLCLAVGVGLYCYPPRWPLLWLGAIVAGLLLLGVLAPSLLVAILFGSQLGLAVLALLLGLLWIRQQRWRRQVVLLPTFTRGKAGSSLLRTSALRSPREPSTVDAPRSSQLPAREETRPLEGGKH